MEQIIKAFTGLFVILVMSFSAAGLIGASIMSRNADSYLDAVALQWEASNFTMTEADFYRTLNMDEEAYRLDLTVSPGVDSLRTGFATARLTYTLRVPVIGLSTERSITKCMR